MSLSVARKTSVPLLRLLLLISFTPMAQASGQGGVIHFSGQIVEPPCEINHVQQHIAMSCDNEGHTQTRNYSTQELQKAPEHFKQIAAVNLRYLDEKKKLAVINIDYR
ncbi:type 1 fimbrial protein [Citrobacter sp. ANG330]|uniref:type 1 fimbrial protein n=1 Tax=Citrobacter sp. ANG330 TaxID=3048142 RepID=UPI0039C2C4B0